jgi:hypothetical protein
MSIATDPTTEQLIAELYKIPGKAEIVGGRIVMMSPTGDMPNAAALAIAADAEPAVPGWNFYVDELFE